MYGLDRRKRPTALNVPAAWRAIIFAIMVGTVVFAGAETAQAACHAVTIGSFSSNPVTWRGSSTGYDPLDSTNYSQPVTFTVSKRGGSCTVIIGATTGGSDTGSNRTLSNGSNTLSFNFYTDAQLQNIVRNPPNATSSQVFVYSFDPGGPPRTATVTFYLNVPPQQLTGNNMLVPTGTYSQTVTFNAYTGTLNAPGPPVSTTNVNFQASVQSDMQVSIVPQGQSFNPYSLAQVVNLQTIDLQTAASGNVDFWVRANTGFKLQLASQNKGVMRYLANPTDTSVVPYTLSLKVNGIYTPVNLSNVVTLSAASGATGIGGVDFPISIAVSNLSNTQSFPVTQNLPLAGNYADVVTITGIAQ